MVFVRARPATIEDVSTIAGLIKELATYEGAAVEAVAREEDLRVALFGDLSNVFCHVGEVDGEVVAIALWFLNFSSWLGSSGLYLSDLFVKEAFRGRGIGAALMKELARICVTRGYPRFQWSVLDWNTPSINFYDSIGAVPLSGQTTYRLSGEALRTYGTSG
jgi:GNAT superfamily N-acetyltransferase